VALLAVVGQLAEGHDWAEAALAVPGADAPTIARVGALGAAGSIAYWRSERELAVERYREQLALAQRLGDMAGTADAWFNLAAAIFVAGDRDESVQCAAEARRLYLEVGDERGVNRCDWAATNLIMEAEGPAAMLVALQPVLARAIALGDAAYVVLCGGSMAWGSFMLGDMTSAARWGIQSILTSYGMRDVAGSTIALPITATIAIEFGHADDAALIMGAFEGLCERYGVRPPIGLEQLIRSSDPGVRLQGIMAPEPLEAALERGRRMTIDEAMDVVVRIADAVPPGDRTT
jgi:hypothetical protein